MSTKAQDDTDIFNVLFFGSREVLYSLQTHDDFIIKFKVCFSSSLMFCRATDLERCVLLLRQTCYNKCYGLIVQTQCFTIH